jgi:uncharacterized coiled-coil protein SlyX
VISELRDVTGEQVTAEETMIAELEAQSSYLESLAGWAKDQLDIMRGVDISISSVADALNMFVSATGSGYPTVEQLAMLQNVAAINAGANNAATAAIETMTQSSASNKQQIKELGDYLRASQLSISDNTNQIKKLLEKFDAIGMPPVREDA